VPARFTTHNRNGCSPAHRRCSNVRHQQPRGGLRGRSCNCFFRSRANPIRSVDVAMPRLCSPAALRVTECLPWGVRCTCRAPLTSFFRACCRTAAAAFTTIRVTRDEGLAIIRFSRPDKFNSFIGEQCVPVQKLRPVLPGLTFVLFLV
jgi:hypothetical protein